MTIKGFTRGERGLYSSRCKKAALQEPSITHTMRRISLLSREQMEFSLNSRYLINHRRVNWAQFKDHISHMCRAGTVVASWSTQEVADSNLLLKWQIF